MHAKRWLGPFVVVAVSLACPTAWATVTPSPATIAIGNVDIGSSAGGSTSVSTDQATETIAMFDLTACTTEFAVTTTTPDVLVMGVSKTVDVTFAPAARGLRTCTVTMRDAGNTAIGTFQITGTGLAEELTITTAQPVDFGTVRVTTGASATKNIVLKNTGDTGHTLSITALALSGANSGDFTITAPTTFPQNIAPNATLNVTVQFNPSAAGLRTASLDITSSDPVNPAQSAMLQGTGGNATIAVSDVNFGTVPDNTTSPAQSISVTNSAATFPGTLKVTSAVIDTVSSTWFTFAAGAGCTAGTTSCTLSPNIAPLSVPVQCKPPTGSTGTQMTTVTFTSDSDAGGDSVAQLTCTAGKPIATVSSTALAFGNQLVNTTSSAMTFTVANNGNEDLTFYLSKSGTDPTLFAASVMGSACGTSAANKCTVTASTSMTVQVTFTPTTPGSKVATLTVNTNDTASPTVNLSLTGKGTAPQIAPNTNPLAFSTVEVNKSFTQTLTVTNTGDAPLTITNAALSGSPDYSVTNGLVGTQTTTIAPMGTASWDIRCAPTSQGARPASAFTVTSDAFTTPSLVVNLTCTGLQGRLAVAPATTNFGGVRIGDMVTQTFVLSNPGNVAVNNINYMFDNAGVGYSVAGPTFPIASLAAGTNVTVTVQFAPMATTDGGNHTVTFSGTWGAGNAQTAMAGEALTGTPLAAGYDTVPSQAQGQDWGNVRYDQTLSKTISIVNTVPPPDTTTTVKILTMGITPVTSMTGEFTVTGCTHNGTAVTCPAAATPFSLVGANDTLVVTIRCAPASRVAMLSAKLDVHSDLGTNPDRHVPLTANSTTATLALSPGTVVDFGPSDIDAGAKTQTLVVQNMGTASLTLNAATVSCPAGCAYSFGPTGAQTVAPGGMFSVNITYTPTLEKPGPCPGANCDNATITWPYSGVCGGGATCMGPSSVSITIQGRGIDRHISAAVPPSFTAFRNPGTAAPVLPETITNNGEATLHVSAVMVSNDPIWQVLNPQPVDVPGHGSYDFMIQFSPNVAGKAPDGQLLIMNNDNGMPMVMVTLQGTGLARNVDMSPNVIDLGYTGINIPVHLSVIAPSQLLAVTSLDATNTFTIRSIDIQGGDGTFAVTDNNGNAPANLMLAPSSTQSFDITFTPNAEGDFSATATLYLDMDPTAQATVTLQGHGVFADAHGGGGCQSGRGAGGGALLVVGALVAALRRRRALLGLVVLAGIAGVARAGGERDLDLTVFNPTPATNGNAFQLQSADVGENGAWVITGLASYASNPLVISTAQNTDAAVQSRTMLVLGGAYAFLGRFEAGARLPLYFQSGQTIDSSTMAGVPPASGTARGDLTLHGRARLWRGDALGGELLAGAGLALTLPTATSDQFAGVSKPEGRVLALLEHRPAALDHRLAIDVNLGGVIRAKTRFANVSQGSGIAWGVGGSYRVLDELWATAEVFGDVLPSGHYAAPTMPGTATGAAGILATTEALAGVHYQMERRVNVGLAVGRGLTTGIGSPDLRGVLLVTVAPGAADLAPLPGHGGGEDRDSDGDGIPDSRDKCPNEPEDKDMFQDEDGCPDLDNDGDGIPDAQDKCPLDPEDKDGFQDADGCPDKDNDGDGIPDAQDKCPNEPEDKDGFQDLDGCPDPDNDHDGIPDKQDKCPNDPETINGYQDDDGCPDKGDSAIVVSPDRLEVLEAVQFSGTKIAKSSFNVLGQIGATLRAHPEIVRLRLTVHVQPTSHADADQALSDKRAIAVRDWLVQWGVQTSRLEPKGFGGTKPLVPPDQHGAAQINERIELIILERK